MPVPNSIILHAPPISYHLLAAQQELYRRDHRKNTEEFSGKKSREWTIRYFLDDA